MVRYSQSAVSEYYNSKVVVDDSMAHRVYLTYGNNLVGLSHGKEEHSLHTVMQLEQEVG